MDMKNDRKRTIYGQMRQSTRTQKQILIVLGQSEDRNPQADLILFEFNLSVWILCLKRLVNQGCVRRGLL